MPCKTISLQNAIPDYSSEAKVDRCCIVLMQQLRGLAEVGTHITERCRHINRLVVQPPHL